LFFQTVLEKFTGQRIREKDHRQNFSKFFPVRDSTRILHNHDIRLTDTAEHLFRDTTTKQTYHDTLDVPWMTTISTLCFSGVSRIASVRSRDVVSTSETADIGVQGGNVFFLPRGDILPLSWIPEFQPSLSPSELRIGG